MADQQPAAAAGNNFAGAPAGNNNNVIEQNNNGGPLQPHPFFNVRDRLFHALFYRISIAYARAVPKPFRVVLECCALIKV